MTNPCRFIFWIVTGLSLMSMVACQKSSPADGLYRVTEEDAASIISNCILPQYGGMLVQVNSCLSSTAKFADNCVISKDSTLSGTSLSNALISFNYNQQWHYLKNCMDSSFKATYKGGNNYEGVRFSSNDQSSGSYLFVTNAQVRGLYQLNVNMERTGSQRVKQVGQHTFSSTVTCGGLNIVINKGSGKIQSGKMNVQMTGSSGSPFSYAGTFTFSGNNKGVLILNSGLAYHLSW